MSHTEVPDRDGQGTNSKCESQGCLRRSASQMCTTRLHTESRCQAASELCVGVMTEEIAPSGPLIRMRRGLLRSLPRSFSGSATTLRSRKTRSAAASCARLSDAAANSRERNGTLG